ADWEAVLDIDRPLSVVGQLVLLVFAQSKIVPLEAVPLEKRHAVLDPPLVPVLVGGTALHRVAGVHEVLDLHLLELSGPKDEVPGCDLVAERFADLADAER